LSSDALAEKLSRSSVKPLQIVPPRCTIEWGFTTYVCTNVGDGLLKYSIQVLLGLCVVVSIWGLVLSDDNSIVIYFGRPADVVGYLSTNWQHLAYASLSCLLTAVASLILAAFLTIVLLVIGLVRENWLSRVEWLAATSQTIPFLAIVIVFLLVERSVFELVDVAPITGVYSVAPVTISLIFPPLVYGAKSIIRTQIQVKSLLKIWNAPRWWRIAHVYIPSAIPDILTGLRASAAWAIGATLISDGLLVGIELDARTLGHLLTRPFSSSPPGQTPSIILISTVLAFAVYELFKLVQGNIERRILGSSAQTEEAHSLLGS
jgi:ABC-type nitrate/sulfonate/bicarbonate transport system permease component